MEQLTELEKRVLATFEALVPKMTQMDRPIRQGRRGEYKEMLERSMKHETHRDDQTSG